MPTQNLFGDLALDSTLQDVRTESAATWLLRRLAKAMSRLTFDATNQLRTTVGGTVAISGTVAVSTVTTVTTDNIGYGDMGKPATVMLVSRQLTGASTRRNLIRT